MMIRAVVALMGVGPPLNANLRFAVQRLLHKRSGRFALRTLDIVRCCRHAA